MFQVIFETAYHFLLIHFQRAEHPETPSDPYRPLTVTIVLEVPNTH